MKAVEDHLLEQCHKTFIETCFGNFPMHNIPAIVSEKITGYGTNVNEKVQSLLEFTDILNQQRKESEDLQISFALNRVSKTIISDGTVALIIEEGVANMIVEDKKLDLAIRISFLYEYENSNWMAVHFHGSIPQGVEGDRDTWAVNEWKEKNEQLEKIIVERTKELSESLANLKATQNQLIHSEKMASLGELTAGIAHEIQNPLNFVNNFSELSNELIDEMKDELDNGDIEEAKSISEDIKQNLEKINHHGKRADSIVKGMLQHSRTSSADKESTDINKLVDEYLRLAYHGLRAKDKSFNASLESSYDDAIGEVAVIPQDIGRVILNLITNAFYAVQDKQRNTKNEEYKPTVFVKTKKDNKQIVITVGDNGDGIPNQVIDKIFQPFFTTKPTGQGTGLGLSMSYDIVTKGHSGTLEVKTDPNQGTEFTIKIPTIKTKTL